MLSAPRELFYVVFMDFEIVSSWLFLCSQKCKTIQLSLAIQEAWSFHNLKTLINLSHQGKKSWCTEQLHNFSINTHLIEQFPPAPCNARFQRKIYHYLRQTCIIWFARRILLIVREKLRLNSVESKMLRMPLCSNEMWLTLMCCKASAMNSVRLFLTTHPSKVSSRLGTLKDATGPRSRFTKIAEKCLIRMPKNWIYKPWRWWKVKRVDKVRNVTWRRIIAVGGRNCKI